MLLPLARPLHEGAELWLRYYPLLDEERHPSSRFTLSVNGVVVDRWTCTGRPEPGERLVSLPERVTRGARAMVVGLRLHDAAAPRDLGLNGDVRLLGLCLLALCLRPRQAENARPAA